jgi:hypothetical protein
LAQGWYQLCLGVNEWLMMIAMASSLRRQNYIILIMPTKKNIIHRHGIGVIFVIWVTNPTPANVPKPLLIFLLP